MKTDAVVRPPSRSPLRQTRANGWVVVATTVGCYEKLRLLSDISRGVCVCLSTGLLSLQYCHTGTALQECFRESANKRRWHNAALVVSLQICKQAKFSGLTGERIGCCCSQCSTLAKASMARLVRPMANRSRRDGWWACGASLGARNCNYSTWTH